MAPACQSIPERSAAAMTGTSSRMEGVTPALKTEKGTCRSQRPPDMIISSTAYTYTAY